MHKKHSFYLSSVCMCEHLNGFLGFAQQNATPERNVRNKDLKVTFLFFAVFQS